MDASFAEADPTPPEPFLALLHGCFALLLGAAVWSAMAVIFGAWSLPAAPALGWMIAWACRYGGRRSDALVRAEAWLLALGGIVLALFAYSAFSVTQSSPDSGFRLQAIALECLGLLTDPPWFGSAAVLLALAGARRALRAGPPRRASARPVPESSGAAERVGPGSQGAGIGMESGSRAA